jgi:uncharacterized secreted repeat protein (TIGR03808 family)
MPYYWAQNGIVFVTPATASPGPGWVSSSLQAAIDYGRGNGMVVWLLPGLFVTGQLTVNQSNGSGKPFEIRAIPGSVTIQLQSADVNLLEINGIANVSISGIRFDGAAQTITDAAYPSGLVVFRSAQSFLLYNCEFVNSPAAGVVAREHSVGSVKESRISSCDTAAYAHDSKVDFIGNEIATCWNNGIVVQRSAAEFDGSVIERNAISDIRNNSGGTGQYGNGIVVYQSAGVKSLHNTIQTASYSCIRYNASAGALVSANSCYGARECSIFLETPAQGASLDGGVVSNNFVIGGGDGIKIVNYDLSGQYGGVTRRVAVTGNHIANIHKTRIDDPGYVPTISNANGIQVEGVCAVTGNIVEDAQGFGIIAGTNLAADDLLLSGNSVRVSGYGIGYSSAAGAGQISIVANMLSGNQGGSIAPCYLNTSGNFVRDAGPDLGNQPDSQIGNLFVGTNRSF